ncbi:T-cell activation inhibitor, mitochondrial-like isoform X2 [Homarus americanus]|uniref:T-cell activation inhibitor, mitochondrial-like isoform X2 n=1 Tax=Homarus americanus TaxID=6706 RepID=UPI001C492624|nr:T-cell activation inhibitor, mitochondrial-like isoform X2 [Homarus americanus]
MHIITSRAPRQLLYEIKNSCRNLSSAQVTTALRPFYFLVHPDLFGQHPRAQHVNDASLKLLNSHLDSLINHEKPRPVSLQFYIKNKKMQGSLNTVALNLNKPSARDIVHRILNEFDLPTKYVDNLPESLHEPDRKIKWHQPFHGGSSTFNPEDELYSARLRENLYSWLIKNMGEAERRLAVSEPIRQDIVRLRHSLIEELNLSQLSWQRGLGTTHLRGCLQGLKALTMHHQEIKEILQGRAVHFGNETGVSLEGHVVLSTSEVRNQWLKVICKLPEEDSMIQRIPDMQRAVSNALREIQVTHRKYQPFVLVEHYIQHLRRLVTSLGDYRGREGFPKSWPEKLSSLQLVVESAAGPLMLSPTGQILAPSSCPPWLLVNFITENMDQAEKMIAEYESIRDQEKDLYEKCKEDLGLEFLEKDDSVMPNMMIECLERLLDSGYRLSPLLSGARIWITHYYAVMVDGEVCIPWNWDQEKF